MDFAKLNPQDKATWVNIPAPPVPAFLQETLNRIGGFADNEVPIYKLAWGQSEKHHSRGRNRIRFLDRRIPIVYTQERFFLPPETLEKATTWKSKISAYGSNIEPESILPFLQAENLEYILLPEVRDIRRGLLTPYQRIADLNAPEGWLYFSNISNIEQIGRQCWYVLRHLDPAEFGGRPAWEAQRYKYNLYVPELHREVAVVDDLGEYPEHYYAAMFEIAEYELDQNGEIVDYAYLEPNETNCIQPVLEFEYDRLRMTNQEKSREWQMKAGEEDSINQDELLMREKEQEALTLVDPYRPAFKGNPFSAPTPNILVAKK